MDNQHKKIKGYRDLSQDEIDLMNRIKEQGECLAMMIQDLECLSSKGLSPDQQNHRFECLMNASKDLKQGIMWSVRSVALPDSF
ncbi:hypothetical protein S141_38 [Shewanella sp. phage 1/41]|uniref:hypothetical protein n=1 Tax=Shewanella sp. phage 1/41 TaxID=1458861 RepID=UPI0004F90322|nr:hypothetical protein S141_38 [Shewanella sp. phage 1/41]AHK11684.1 hypothetical protein S141_38 [Shewanella sp. phage 1/41]